MNSSSEVTIKAEMSEIKTQLTEALTRLARNEATIEQLNKSIAAGNRMTNWQFIGFVMVMAGTLLGSMYWATGVIERRIEQSENNFNARFGQLEQRIEKSEKNLEARIKQSEENLNARFEDLKQAVYSKR